MTGPPPRLGVVDLLCDECFVWTDDEVEDVVQLGMPSLSARLRMAASAGFVRRMLSTWSTGLAVDG